MKNIKAYARVRAAVLALIEKYDEMRPQCDGMLPGCQAACPLCIEYKDCEHCLFTRLKYTGIVGKSLPCLRSRSLWRSRTSENIAVRKAFWTEFLETLKQSDDMYDIRRKMLSHENRFNKKHNL